MEYLVIRTHLDGSGRNVKGSKISLDNHEAEYLLSAGLIVEYKQPEEKKSKRSDKKK